ncbi:protein kinase [Archangium gephyra]|uniref:protein kinase domain-containing protein n=1 Tax=Archangium gephyra TaxID=48 RepID=UPI0035D3FF96
MLARRYAIEHLIGEGTFGWVLSAIELSAAPPRRVALKMLRHHRAAREDAVRRFERRELELLRRVHATQSTPHVVRALEPGLLWHEGLPFMVLELIEGPSLREVMEGGVLEPEQVRRLGAGIARGLAAIHAAGGIHCDLKPTNICLRGGKEPVIVDSGISRALWETQEHTEPGPWPLTPRYAAPEQLAGRKTGPASDIYSLGVILHELFTGEVPSGGQPATERRRIPPALLGLVERCLAHDPERRPEALDVARQLSSLEEVPRRFPVRRGLMLLAPLLITLGAVVLMRGGTPRPRTLPAPGAGAMPEDPGPWSRRFGDAGEQKYLRLALDPWGNPFIAGFFRGSLALDTGPVTSAGLDDILVARLGPDGRMLWSHRLGDEGIQAATALAADATGTLFVTGYFSDALELGGREFFNSAGPDVFLSRWNAEGRVLWSRRFGDEQAQYATTVAVDPEGGAILGGYFYGTMDLGGEALVSAGLSDGFLARFTADGQLLWGQRFGDSGHQTLQHLTVGPAGHIAVTGTFEGQLDFGGGLLSGTGSRDYFLALFDANGRFLWGQHQPLRGTRGSSYPAFDSEGHVILLSSHEGLAGVRGISASKFTPEGRLLWSHRLGDTERMHPAGAAALPGGRLLVTGLVGGSAVFGDGPLPGMGGDDVILLELGADGSLLGARRFGDAAAQYAYSVAVDASGHVFLAGAFEGTLDLGATPLKSAGGPDLFVARLEPSAATAGAPPPEGGCLAPLPGLVAWYPLDGPDPGAVLGRARPGQLVGAVSPVTGRVRGALALEGGFFQAPDTQALDLGEGDLSLAAWIRTTDAEEVKVLLDKRHEGPSQKDPVVGYALFLYRGRLSFQLADGKGSGRCNMHPGAASCSNYQSGHFVADGAWHLVTLTVERGAQDGGTFYVDGVPVARFNPLLHPRSLDNGKPLRLGSRSSSETGLLHGLLDEVTVWNRALTPAEVSRLYQAGGAGMCHGGPQGR